MIETVATATSTNLATREVKKNLGKDDFLMLLTKQMQYQDPMEPMKNEDLISQLAQFSALEQTANLNENFKGFMTSQNDSYRLQVLELIGKEVKAVRPTENDGEVFKIEGTVSSVSIRNDQAVLQVGENAILVSELTYVGEPGGEAEDEGSSSSEDQG